MINIIENTLRDGSYVNDFQFTKEQTRKVVSELDALGFEYIEVGHGLGLGAYNNPKCGLSAENDEVYIRTAREAAKKSKIVSFFIPGIGTVEDIRIAKSNGLDFIRCGINISEFRKVKPYAEEAKKLGLRIAINLMKSYAVKAYEFSKIVQEIDSWQLADVIYLVDSAGCMFPNEVDEYIDRTKQKVTKPLGFHGHNNLSMGIANSIQAMKSGASYIDTCVRGMGRSAGNAQTEIFIWALKKMGIEIGIDLYDLYDFADQTLLPMMERPQGLSSEEIHIGVAKFHTSYLPMVEKSIQKFNVPKRELIKAASDVNCLNPTQELFDDVSLNLSKLNKS
jgi:4-hydroxy-2-oxovalerate aldolase